MSQSYRPNDFFLKQSFRHGYSMESLHSHQAVFSCLIQNAPYTKNLFKPEET